MSLLLLIVLILFLVGGSAQLWLITRMAMRPRASPGVLVVVLVVMLLTGRL